MQRLRSRKKSSWAAARSAWSLPAIASLCSSGRTATISISSPAGGKCSTSTGNHRGSRNPAGFYPDDLAVSIDGRHLFVVSSGQAEGDPKKPMPALETFELDLAAGSGRLRRRVEFDRRDDPARLTLSASGRFAAVLLAKTYQTVGFDVSVPENPHLVGRTKPSSAEVPYVSQSPDSDWIMMPVASPSEAIAIPSPIKRPDQVAMTTTDSIPSPDYVICARHRESVVELMQTAPLYPLGRLPLTGPLNMGKTRPTGLAYSPERGLLAVSTRSGSIHLLELACAGAETPNQTSAARSRSRPMPRPAADGFVRRPAPHRAFIRFVPRKQIPIPPHSGQDSEKCGNIEGRGDTP